MSRRRLVMTVSLFLASGGCLGEPCPGDLLTQGVYRLEADSDEQSGVEVAAIGVEGSLLVSGRLKARHHRGGPVSATGKASLVSPDGTVLGWQPLSYTPSRHGRRSHPPATFTARFPFLPPVGTTIRVQHTTPPPAGYGAAFNSCISPISAAWAFTTLCARSRNARRRRDGSARWASTKAPAWWEASVRECPGGCGPRVTRDDQAVRPHRGRDGEDPPLTRYPVPGPHPFSSHPRPLSAHNDSRAPE